ncbi:LacI family DNA-binding transcriptional regulator [Streptomyces griseiscabiei]|uniref:Substrate-binding domain-containing protein n=1 Tax=Streptomyces griseiscabiei TaxID=2993540 RepID=A0ABU4L4F5_9ACTN|nr:substrate-binding domain-containing protein [Streptomyces griseiscabiei]MBZ3905486.1 substrate-binding domain-containing protein [Streptomyces griseiscabiei]MDX2910577.1 substrate-binding domain-containing protein [Streptomyces griseiscabiei]
MLNRPEIVADTTRTRVLSVIDSLGYVRAGGANPRAGSARVLAVMVADLANPFYTALVSGVEQAARETGLSVTVCTGPRDPADLSRHMALMSSHQIRGAVLTSGEDIGRTVAAFRRGAVPFVMADQNAPQPAASSVGVDDVANGHSAVRHLLELGHRSIVHVSGPARLQQTRDRLTGAREAVTTTGLPPTALRELPCYDLTIPAGEDAGHRVLGLRPRPTAVFCANDLLALGVLRTLHEAGLRVPDDIALIGYDDIEFAASATVPLTTVRRPATLMGHRAGHLLIADTTENTSPKHRHVVLKPELVVRRSTTGIRKAAGAAAHP